MKIHKCKIINIMLFVCFLTNIFCADSYPLSTASMNNGLIGIQHKDTGRIRIAIASELREVFAIKNSTSKEAFLALKQHIKKAIEEHTIFQPAKTQILYSEAKLRKDGIHLICKIKDGDELRKYYAVFNPIQAEGQIEPTKENFPTNNLGIKVYTERQYDYKYKFDRNFELKKEDEEAVVRYIEHEENIDDFYDEILTKGVEGEDYIIVGKQSSLEHKLLDEYIKLNERLEYLEIPEENRRLIMDAIKKRDMIIINPKHGTPKITMLNEKGIPQKISVYGHSSMNNIFISLYSDQRLWQALKKLLNFENTEQKSGSKYSGNNLENLIYTITRILEHEAGAICGLKAIAERRVIGYGGYIFEPLVDPITAYNDIDRMRAAKNKAWTTEVEQEIARLAETLKDIKPVDLNINLLNRDYAAGPYSKDNIVLFMGYVHNFELVIKSERRDGIALIKNLKQFIDDFMGEDNLKDTKVARAIEKTLWRMFEYPEIRKEAIELTRLSIPQDSAGQLAQAMFVKVLGYLKDSDDGEEIKTLLELIAAEVPEQGIEQIVQEAKEALKRKEPVGPAPGPEKDLRSNTEEAEGSQDASELDRQTGGPISALLNPLIGVVTPNGIVIGPVGTDPTGTRILEEIDKFIEGLTESGHPSVIGLDLSFISKDFLNSDVIPFVEHRTRGTKKDIIIVGDAQANKLKEKVQAKTGDTSADVLIITSEEKKQNNAFGEIENAKVVAVTIGDSDDNFPRGYAAGDPMIGPHGGMPSYTYTIAQALRNLLIPSDSDSLKTILEETNDFIEDVKREDNIIAIGIDISAINESFTNRLGDFLDNKAQESGPDILVITFEQTSFLKNKLQEHGKGTTNVLIITSEEKKNDNTFGEIENATVIAVEESPGHIQDASPGRGAFSVDPFEDSETIQKIRTAAQEAKEADQTLLIGIYVPSKNDIPQAYILWEEIMLAKLDVSRYRRIVTVFIFNEKESIEMRLKKSQEEEGETKLVIIIPGQSEAHNMFDSIENATIIPMVKDAYYFRRIQEIGPTIRQMFDYDLQEKKTNLTDEIKERLEKDNEDMQVLFLEKEAVSAFKAAVYGIKNIQHFKILLEISDGTFQQPLFFAFGEKLKEILEIDDIDTVTNIIGDIDSLGELLNELGLADEIRQRLGDKGYKEVGALFAEKQAINAFKAAVYSIKDITHFNILLDIAEGKYAEPEDYSFFSDILKSTLEIDGIYPIFNVVKNIDDIRILLNGLDPDTDLFPQGYEKKGPIKPEKTSPDSKPGADTLTNALTAGEKIRTTLIQMGVQNDSIEKIMDEIIRLISASKNEKCIIAIDKNIYYDANDMENAFLFLKAMLDISKITGTSHNIVAPSEKTEKLLASIRGIINREKSPPQLLIITEASRVDVFDDIKNSCPSAAIIGVDKNGPTIVSKSGAGDSSIFPKDAPMELSERKMKYVLTGLGLIGASLGEQLAPPVNRYTVFTSGDFYKDKEEHNKDKVNYYHRLNLKWINDNNAESYIEQVDKAITELLKKGKDQEGIDSAEEVIVQLPVSEDTPSNLYLLTDRKVRVVTVDLTDPALKYDSDREQHRMDLYYMMLLSRWITQEDIENNTLVYNTLQIYINALLKSSKGDFQAAAEYIANMAADKMSEIVGSVLRWEEPKELKLDALTQTLRFA